MSSPARFAAVAAAIAFQMVVLYAPRTPSVSETGLPLDKVVHVVAFAVPTAALIVAGVQRRWVVTGMVAHAIASELVQHHLLANRSGEVGDVVADLIGVAVGAVVVRGPSSRPVAG